MRHEGGHLPFETDITAHLSSEMNLVTVAVNNTLNAVSIPQGFWRWKDQSAGYPAGYFVNEYTFDFFNYAGIHRPVDLYTVPKTIRITDTTITTTLSPDLSQATLNYHVEAESSDGDVSCFVELRDAEANLVAGGSNCQSQLDIPNPKIWWPFTMDANPGYLHQLVVTVSNDGQSDVYRFNVGLRQVSWDADTFRINHQVRESLLT